jgi:aryl-alcohol dehydrogenase-like predicted oxidoreductase
MKTRALGRTGIQVSEIGLGAWGLGAAGWPGVGDDEGISGLRTAFDLGVTFVDTALAYGNGHSERTIAKALSGRVDASSIAIATKIPPKNFIWPAAARSRIAEVFPASYVREATETSLRNLDRESIDVQQFHVWHDAWLDQPEWEATHETMRRLREEGKVRHWGISTNDHEPSTALSALTLPIFETVQVIYNVYDREPDEALFPLAAELKLGVIARVPFDEGALTGAVRADTVFRDDDWRGRYFRGDRKAEAARRADALLPLLGDEASSLSELALRLVLSSPVVSTVIPGMRRPAHARANAGVSDGRVLSDRLLEKLRKHAWIKNWYVD